MALTAALLLLAGCATTPIRYSRPAPEFAHPPGPDGELFLQEAKLQQAHGDTASGFLLLDRNEEGLRWRLALVDSAQHSLDLQYYLWYGDDSGVLLMEHVLRAANRGVKVRIIVDDLDTMLRDAATPVVRDRPFAAVDVHPNIEIRLFNPWRHRSLVGRVVELAGDMDHLNQRMHNKQMVADNRAAIIGGRNIGNEYLGLNSDFNFHDLDVLGIGPVARQASGIFDRFWNSEWVMPVAALQESFTKQELKELHAQLIRRLQGSEILDRRMLEAADWSDRFSTLSEPLSIGTSRVLTDSPDDDGVSHHMPKAILELIGSAKQEVLITNAYIIPGPKAVDAVRQLTQRGVRLRVLTNSLASHDVPAVNSHYKPWRRPLIEAGVELYEVRPDAAIRRSVADTPPVDSGFMGLHSKGIVVDRERVFIGSMNLDPRSSQINSEMGLIIDSPDLARRLADVMGRDMAPENSWRVEIDPEGDLRWVSGSEVQTRQPARNFMQRVQDVLFMMFPKEIY